MKVLDIVDKNNRPGALGFLGATDDRSGSRSTRSASVAAQVLQAIQRS